MYETMSNHSVEPLSRSDKIQIIKGVIQTIGLLLLIVGMTWMIKNFNERKIMGECYYVYDNGTREPTGLYGNCSWYQERINPPPEEKTLKITTLQNEDIVNNSFITEVPNAKT